jgi:uncharacterized membrane protein
MNIEKNLLYQILIFSGITISILLWFVIPYLILIFPIILFIGIILLVMIRKKGHLDDERVAKISEKASEKTIIVFIFGSMFLTFIFGSLLILLKDLFFKDEFPRWILELTSSMFQSAIIISVIYLVFYVYYRYMYGGVLK